MSGVSARDLTAVLAALASWHSPGARFQLHPGDLGWFWRFGRDELAGAVQAFEDHGEIFAVGLLDGSAFRVAVDPSRADDEALASVVVDGIPGAASVAEVPQGCALREALLFRGWTLGDEWVVLERDVQAPIGESVLAFRVVDGTSVTDRVAVQRASFTNSTFTAERWRAMASGPAFALAQDLVGYDAHGVAVAAATVWSAGEGRPGLIEPLGVHRDHRNRGHGRAVAIASAAALGELGASSALVATPKANTGAVATYTSAGFRKRAVVADLTRP